MLLVRLNETERESARMLPSVLGEDGRVDLRSGEASLVDFERALVAAYERARRMRCWYQSRAGQTW